MSKLPCLAMAFFLVGNDALAQLASGETPPVIIQGVKQASGVCRSDMPVERGKMMDNRSRVLADRSCAITIAEVAPLLTHPDTLLVDLRSAADFAAFHALDAINLSAGELRHKSHWKNKTLVLLGRGKAEDELYEECAGLKQSGFRQVRVVRGGMPMWLAHRLPVVGHQASAAQFARLTAAELWLESLSPHNLLLMADTLADMQGEFPRAQILQQVSLELIQAAVIRQRGGRRGTSVTAVVLISEQITDARIEQWQQALMPIPLLVYADGKKNYERDIAAQKAMWDALARGPKQLRCGL